MVGERPCGRASIRGSAPWSSVMIPLVALSRDQEVDGRQHVNLSVFSLPLSNMGTTSGLPACPWIAGWGEVQVWMSLTGCQRRFPLVDRAYLG
jgi:hypothetical protein